MTNVNLSEAMLEVVQKTTRKLEAFTNIPFYISPVPEELELREHEIDSLIGHYISYIVFSSVSAVRFNFRAGLNQRSKHLLHSCDVWIKETSLNIPTYTVLLNPNAKSEISGGVRTIADLLLGKKTSLKKESEIRFTPKVILEKIQNDIDEFIDSVGIDNIKSLPLSKIYNQYSTWADADNQRVITKPQFYRVFKDFLVQKRITSDTVSTGHVYSGAVYSFKANLEEEKIFGEEIVRNKAYYKSRLFELLTLRMAQGDPEINGMLVCGQIANELNIVKTQIKLVSAQRKVVYFREMYGFAGLITALWQNRMGKILVFSKADGLFSSYNSTIRKILHSLLEKDGNRLIQYIRPVKQMLPADRQKENLRYILSEAKSPQPKPNTVSNGEYNIDDIVDSEDKLYDTAEEGIPERFEFKSKVIFLTDLPAIPEDFRNFPYALELNYTKEQALSLVESNLDNIMVGFPEVNLQRKREILTFMRTNKRFAKSFSYDTFWHIAMIYMSGLKNWKRWGIAQLTGLSLPA